MKKHGKRRIDLDDSRLWESYAASPTEVARNRLVERYMPLVRTMARARERRSRWTIRADDLIAVGVFGLIDAVEGFEPGRGLKFTTYATPRIRGAMLDELRRLDWRGRTARIRITRVDRARAELAARHSRPPTDAELAEHLGLEGAEYRRAVADADTVVTSLDMRRAGSAPGKAATLAHVIIDDVAPAPWDDAQRADLLAVAMKSLNRDERSVLRLYYYEHKPMREIGKAIGQTESRVSQIHAAVIEQLRVRLAGRQHEFTA